MQKPVAIGRQFGSGGHDIGKALAEKLGYDFYDAEIIQMTAGTTGYTPEFVKKNEEIMTNSLLYDLVNQMYLNTDRMKHRRIKFSRQNARLYAILRKKAIA